MAMNICQHRGGCKNAVRSGQTHCYLHGGSSAEELNSGAPRGPGTITIRELESARRVRREFLRSPMREHLSRPPAGMQSPTTMGRQAESYARNVGVGEDVVNAVLRATQSAVGVMNVESPADSARARVHLARIADAVGSEIGHDRVMIAQMRGLARRTANGRRLVNASAVHQVLVIDQGTESEVVVDPFVAALAPVSREMAELPVIKSGMRGLSRSPYVDSPWIGPLADYMDNGYVEWFAAERVPSS